jgi:hypothetical protein
VRIVNYSVRPGRRPHAQIGSSNLVSVSSTNPGRINSGPWRGNDSNLWLNVSYRLNYGHWLYHCHRLFHVPEQVWRAVLEVLFLYNITCGVSLLSEWRSDYRLTNRCRLGRYISVSRTMGMGYSVCEHLYWLDTVLPHNRSYCSLVRRNDVDSGNVSFPRWSTY